jgi:hypothetical protein
MAGPAVVVARVVGRGKGLKVSTVPASMEFVAENHVNVVTFPGVTAERAAVLCSVVAKGLARPEATEALRWVTGNTQLSATELRDFVPIGPASWWTQYGRRKRGTGGR